MPITASPCFKIKTLILDGHCLYTVRRDHAGTLLGFSFTYTGLHGENGLKYAQNGHFGSTLEIYYPNRRINNLIFDCCGVYALYKSMEALWSAIDYLVGHTLSKMGPQ